jgi:hypothetical protein
MVIKAAREMLIDSAFVAEIGDGGHLEHVISFEDAEEALRKYGEQFIDLAAEEAEAEIIISTEHPDFDYAKINKESILKLKEQIK